MAEQDYDVIFIGSGPGGYVGAIRAARALGAHVPATATAASTAAAAPNTRQSSGSTP